MESRRTFLMSRRLVLAAPAVPRVTRARADTVTIRMGALKLIHSISPWMPMSAPNPGRGFRCSLVLAKWLSIPTPPPWAA